MKLVAVGEGCPATLQKAVQESGCFSDVFESHRPLSYHSDCFVTMAKVKATGVQVVVKSYIKDRLSPAAQTQVVCETHIHKRLQNENVIHLLLAFEDCRHYYLVIEYADGGDLRKHLAGQTEKRVRDFIVHPLLRVLTLLEQKGIVHRDLKPDNVLVSHNEVKLADFGLAVYQSQEAADDDGCPCISKIPLHAGGTPLYTAPEVLQAMFKNVGVDQVVSHKNDVWALGVIALEAVSGSHPFSPDKGYCDGNVLFSIANHSRVQLPSFLSHDFQDFLNLALSRDPTVRPSASDLLLHPWITKPNAPGSTASSISGDSSMQHTCGRQSSKNAYYNNSDVVPCFESVDCWEY